MYQDTVQFFSGIGMKYLPSYTAPLREEMRKSNFSMLFETYVGHMLLVSVISCIAATVAVSLLTAFFLQIELLFAIISGVLIGITVFTSVLSLFHYYPFYLASSKRINIEANMPFAINHMSAIAESGVPPFILFKLIERIKEYGEVAYESRRIVRNVELFGMDIVTAVKNVAKRTPSQEFGQFLGGLVSIIETGGDMRKYLQHTADEYLFNYRLKREKYLKILSTYADLYTAVLIAAPLFFVATLSILSLIGGSFFGLPISDALTIGIYGVIPLVNVGFILFVHITQPKS